MSPTKQQFLINEFAPGDHKPQTKSAKGFCSSGLGSICTNDGYAMWTIIWPGDAVRRGVCDGHLAEILRRNKFTNLTAVLPKKVRKAA